MPLTVFLFIYVQCVKNSLLPMLENPSVWLNYKHSEKKNGPEFLHSDLKDPLKVKEGKKKKIFKVG